MRSLQKYSEIFSTRQMISNLILMGISLSVIFGVLVYSSRYNRVFMEPKPLFEILTPKDHMDLKEKQVFVDVGLFIRDFSVFDLVKGEIIFSGSVFFEFDPYDVTLEEIGDFTFTKSTILEKSLPQTMIMGEKIYVRYDVRVSMFLALEYQRFPLDSHCIDIGLINKSFLADTLNNISFVGKNTKFRTNHGSVVETPQWRLYHKFVKYGYIGEHFDMYSKKSVLYYPVSYFTLEYVKKGMKNALLIVLPMLLMLFIGLFGTALDPKKYKTTSVSLAITALSAVIAYRFVIENISPKVAYFMLSDYLYFVFLISIFVVFLLSFIVDRLIVWQKTVCIFLIHGTVIFLNVYFILF